MSLTEGIISPVVIPLTEHDALDRKGLEILVEHLIEGGISDDLIYF